MLRIRVFFLWFLAALPLDLSAAQSQLLNAGPGEVEQQRVIVDVASQYSAMERERIMEWLSRAMEGLRRVYGEWPQQQLRIRIEQSASKSRNGSPVPWGQVIRGRGSQADEVYLQLNLQTRKQLDKDWTVYHELSHTLIPYQGGARWLSEGLASYYQNIIQARLGLLSERQMWQKLLAGFERGKDQNSYDRRTLQEVSDGSGQYMRIHWHGVLYWLTIDAQLRRESNNRLSLDDALRALKRCCEKQSLRPKALVRALDKANNTDLFHRYFEQFQRARTLPDFDRLLESIGVTTRKAKVINLDDDHAMRFVSRGVYLGKAADTPELPDLSSIRETTGVGAVAWAAVEGGVTLQTGADGHYDNSENRQINPNSLIRIGSISKTLLAIGALKLVENKQLDLDARLKSVAPRAPLQNRWPNHPVTLRMLLEHSAGLADLSSEEMNFKNPLSLQAALALAPENRVTLWPAGTHSSYSNAGAGLLSLAIESATKQPFDDWFDSHLRDTLGMSDSTSRWSPGLQDQLVAGYDSDMKSRLPYWHTLFRGFGGVNSTANDMATVLKLFTNQGRIRGLPVLSEHSLVSMQEAKTTLMAQAGVRHGRALGVRLSQFQGNWVISHNGDADGYLARFAYAPATQRAYFVVINAFRDDLLSQFVKPMDSWLLSGSNPIPKAREVEQSVAELAAIQGVYEQATSRFQGNAARIEVGVHQGKVFWSRKLNSKVGSRARNFIKHVGNNTYRRPREFAASIAFVRGSNGKMVLQGPFGNYRQRGSS